MKGSQRRSRKLWVRHGLCARAWLSSRSTFGLFEPGKHVVGLDPHADVHEPASHVAVAALDRSFLDRMCATGQDQFGVPAETTRTAER
jgi:hypothetical protein